MEMKQIEKHCTVENDENGTETEFHCDFLCTEKRLSFSGISPTFAGLKYNLSTEY